VKKGLPFALYFLLTLVMTWPLTPGIARDVPGDLGDSLLNLWILGWDAEHLPRVAAGQMAPHDFWNANIFHPEPLALSFSEHLFGEAIQILPVYYLTGNLILCYNLLFLASFVLSGWGMYLVVRDLLDHRDRFSGAAFVAGLIFAFVPFRIAQVAHIQSVNAQWMPLALYGFRRFIVSRRDGGADRFRLRPLIGGSAALLMQNWSCGYYLIFFTPIVPLFVVHQMITAGRTLDWRRWLAFAVAAIVVAAGTWPFLSLYLEAQRVHGFERSIGEVIRFSADVFSYVTAPEALRFWGPLLQTYPKPEGELFFGVVPMLLAAIALLSLFTQATATVGPPVARRRRILIAVVAAVVVLQLVALAAMLFTGSIVTTFLGIPIRATNAIRLLTGIAVGTGVLLAVSLRARQRARAIARSPLALAIALLVLALWLSLGPLPQSRGRVLPGLGLYGVLYDHVPGFAGLRAPARYAMVAAVFLAMVSGYGVAALTRRVSRQAVVTGLVSAAFIAEVWFAPMLVNQTWGDSGLAPPPRVEPAATAPRIYHDLAAIPDPVVLAEFPFGDPAWELRYVYYSTVHWKRLVNGYSGAFPQSYKVRVARLQRVSEDPEAAMTALREAGATHVIVHERAFADGGAEPVKQWLISHGAVEQTRDGGDVMFALTR
jgi:hypothetical protein